MTIDVAVVGSGPNGLAAAVMMARAGYKVEVYEGADQPGGGCRTEELTLPGFRHDVCSAVHPLLAVSPFFQTVDLVGSSVRLCQPRIAFAHPLDGGRAAAVTRSVDETAKGLAGDAGRYRRLIAPVARDFEKIVPAVLAPMRSPPAHPFAMARFGLQGLLPVRDLARGFRTDEARALLAGAAAHSMRPLGAALTGSFALLFTAIAHSAGWPLVEGGSIRVVEALRAELEGAGGRLVTGRWIRDLSELTQVRTVLLDLTPRGLLALAGDRLPASYRRAMSRYVYGPGICKVDWALAGSVPWLAPACREAGTVHVCGTFEEVARSESDVAAGRHPQRPYCIVVQPGVVDPTRAPAGAHTLWAYCHVPAGSAIDMTDKVEAQIERFAPGFKDLIVAKATITAHEAETHNPNYVGGDINGGAATVMQTIFRPALRWNPYRTPLRGVYLCSSSTPPGGGVHGMCGYWAARTALTDMSRRRYRPR
ncbi:MAG: phytoene desaturase family protein [Pseudonocardiaceae bacterium]